MGMTVPGATDVATFSVQKADGMVTTTAGNAPAVGLDRQRGIDGALGRPACL